MDWENVTITRPLKGSGLFLFFLASCGYIRCWGTTTEKQPNQFSSQGKQSTFHMTFISPLTFQICPRSPLSRRLSSSALNKRVGMESRRMITSGADTGVRERKMATSQVWQSAGLVFIQARWKCHAWFNMPADTCCTCSRVAVLNEFNESRSSVLETTTNAEYSLDCTIGDENILKDCWF